MNVLFDLLNPEGKRQSEPSRASAWFYSAIALFVINVVLGCAPRNYDVSTAMGRAAIIDNVNALLSVQDCRAAIERIEPLYNSSHSDNHARLLRASAHACLARFNFYEKLTDLTTGNFAGTAIWQTFAQMFPSTTNDLRLESSYLAMDSLMAMVTPGTVIAESYRVNYTTDTNDIRFYNPGSIRAIDRTVDSNFMMLFMSMSTVGTIQNRYGEPNANYEKTEDLPWDRSADVDTTGCGFAGALLNLVDSIDGVASTLPTQYATAFTEISDNLTTALGVACALGCAGLDPDLNPVADASCSFPLTECATCPLPMRHRDGCATDTRSACAAAGIVRFINSPTLGWASGS